MNPDRPEPADVARADQVDAAVDTAKRAVGFMAELEGLRAGRNEDAAVERFLADFEARLIAHKVLICSHLTSPNVGLVSFMFPDRMVCQQCYITFIEPARASSPNCDLCGTPSEIFVETIVQKAYVVMMGDLCPSCVPPKEPTT